MTLDQVGWIVLAAAATTAMLAVAVRRQSAALVAGALVVVGAGLLAARRDTSVPLWTIAAAGGFVAVGEAVRVGVDLRGRGTRRVVEADVLRTVATSVGLAMVVTAAGVGFVILGGGARTGWWLVAAVGALAVGTAGAALATDRLGQWRQAARRPAIALGAAVAVVAIGAALVAAGTTADVQSTTGARTTSQEIAPARAADAVTSRDAPPSPIERTSRGVTRDGSGTTIVVIAALSALLILVLFGRREQIVPPEDLVPDPLVRVPLPTSDAAPSAVETVDRVAALVAVDDALVALRADADPRTAIRLAYAMLAGGFGQEGLARRPAETEGDYLRRVLDRLGAGGPAATTLTGLFAVARFGGDDVAPVDDAMRAEALAALATIRTAVAR